ncbi:MAG: DUF6527 family protein [Pyrinomonadaceae bacterium]
MKSEAILTHRFIEYIPDKLEDGVIYISMEFATASHKCGCGCGLEVVTPFTPTDWKLIFDGETISLDPSVGNWSFPCESHYWIINNKIEWSRKWSKEKIKEGRVRDSLKKQQHIEAKIISTAEETQPTTENQKVEQRRSFWQKIREWF